MASIIVWVYSQFHSSTCKFHIYEGDSRPLCHAKIIPGRRWGLEKYRIDLDVSQRICQRCRRAWIAGRRPSMWLIEPAEVRNA